MKLGSSTVHIAKSSLAKTMELKWIKTRPKTLTLDKPNSLSPSPLPSSLPIYISTKPSHVDAAKLRRLYGACSLSGHRFPGLSDSDSDSVDDRKLRIALAHSSFVVSVFCKPRAAREGASAAVGVEGFLQSEVEPVGPYNGELVGFGRAVSDLGLTASIYDVMVESSLRGMGIGKLIVQRIIRMLISREIYDIAALCSEDERPFFEACGFRDDILGSTTMMYTRTVSAGSEYNNQMAKRAGRKLLLIPPLKTPLRLPNP